MRRVAGGLFGTATLSAVDVAGTWNVHAIAYDPTTGATRGHVDVLVPGQDITSL